jgi:hypothetical protein
LAFLTASNRGTAQARHRKSTVADGAPNLDLMETPDRKLSRL